MKEFADKTPADIRPDFQEVADAYAKIADALKGVDLSAGKTPSPEVLAKIVKLSSELDQAKLTKAETNISAWASKNCSGTPYAEPTSRRRRGPGAARGKPAKPPAAVAVDRVMSA